YCSVANILGKPEDGDEINVDERRVTQEAEIIDTLLNGYNPKVRPIGNVLYEGFHRPVVITVSMHIISLKRVDDIKMEYDLQLFLRQKWRDDRLAYAKEGPDAVTLRDNQKIWTPDTFFGNEAEAHRHMLDQPNTLIHIHRDGSVFYSTRLSMTLFCPMDFVKLPFDTQRCNFIIESYAYTEDDIVYIWDNEIAIKYDSNYMTSLPLFEISNITSEGKSVRVKERTYSNIQAIFHLRRKLGYYFYHFYLPTTMLVITSWTAFFLHPSKATARMFIGLGSLALLTLFVSISF
uniref:Neur_chan_LBD domain-containing protein n=1 Tax=Ascaris lumbricoides TaxID=6252 RepID=A0A0M3HXB2_ASCLU